MTRIPLTLLTLAILIAPAAHAQESARARAQRTLPADVFANVSALAVDGSSSGIPDGPLFNKALKGVAKRVPMDRLMPAIETLAGRLGRARTALGPTAGVPLCSSPEPTRSSGAFPRVHCVHSTPRRLARRPRCWC